MFKRANHSFIYFVLYFRSFPYLSLKKFCIKQWTLLTKGNLTELAQEMYFSFKFIRNILSELTFEYKTA